MTRSRTILHIDDDPNVHRIVTRILQKNNYEVFSLEDPTQTSQELIKSGARVVLLDIDMPQIDGLTLLKQIKSHDGGVQVIMLTGFVSMNTVLQSMRWGAEACVFKPLTDFTPLLTAVRASFEKIDFWWDTLHELNQRKSKYQQTV
ncbi:MAG: response regulator [Planctomycetes bacterium]|nr:response regulator [Planctomycetota bacterium]